jgi:hypothetical protein
MGLCPIPCMKTFEKSFHGFSKTFKWGYSDFISLFEDS